MAACSILNTSIRLYYSFQSIVPSFQLIIYAWLIICVLCHPMLHVQNRLLQRQLLQSCKPFSSVQHHFDRTDYEPEFCCLPTLVWNFKMFFMPLVVLENNENECCYKAYKFTFLSMSFIACQHYPYYSLSTQKQQRHYFRTKF